MVQITTKTRIPLDDDWDLYVVNQGANQPAILSVVSHGAVEERFAIHLQPAQSLRVAMALANVTGHTLS